MSPSITAFKHDPGWKVFLTMLSDLRVCGSDGLGLRISLARALSGGLPLGVIA